MKKNLKGDKSREVYFERLDKIVKRKNKKVDFSGMSPYEIINYLREKDIRKNYKVLPSNRFFKRTVIISCCMVFLVLSYSITGTYSVINQNIEILVNKIDGKNNESDIIESYLDYVIHGDFQNLINAYRNNSSISIESHLELVTLLSSINNISQAKEELTLLKNKISHNTLVRNQSDHKNNVYKLLDNLFLYNSLEEAREILDKNVQNLGDEIRFKEKEILYNLLSNNPDNALFIYNGIDLSSINDIDDIISYSKLSVIFNRFDNSLNGIIKTLVSDPENTDVLSVIDMIKYYDMNKANDSLNFFIESQGATPELRFIRAIINIKDVSKTQSNLEDVYEFSKKYHGNMLSNGIRLEILTNANRLDDVDVLLNELKSIKDKNFYVYYILAKHNLKLQNYNESLNNITQSIKLNSDFALSYDVLLNVLVGQNKILNMNYFYLKMKSLDILNTYIDKEFVLKYTNEFNDVNSALDILKFSNKISIYESGLKYQAAKIYIDLKKYEEAKVKLREAIALNEDSIYVRTYGVLLLNMGEVGPGIDSIRRAYELNPKDILNLNNAGAYYANIENNIQRAFSNLESAYEGLDDSYSEYEAFIIRENYFKLKAIYDNATGETLSEEIPILDYLY